jgi:F-type H+-transporting ATPase subunit delta
MKESNMAREYAATLNLLTKGRFEEQAQVMKTIVEQMNASPRLLAFFNHPAISPGEKIALIDKALGGRQPDLLLHILHNLVLRSAMGFLPLIVNELEEIQKKLLNRISAVIISATDLSEAQRSIITDRLSSVTGKKIEPDYQVDPLLIGGMKVKIGDRIIDNSIRTRLENMSNSLFIASLQ